MPAHSNFAIYRGMAQPGLAPRRTYVGLTRVDRWGSTLDEAVDARVGTVGLPIQRPSQCRNCAVWPEIPLQRPSQCRS